VLWLCDKLGRGIQAAHLFAPEEIEWNPRNGLVCMKISKFNYKCYQPGQYYFINIPQISLNEWHPFTASAVLDDSIVFYIKAIPNKSQTFRVPWTARLANLVQSTSAPSLPLMRLSGPFGSMDFEHHDSLLLFAGGIGITPMMATFTSLLRRATLGEGVGRLTAVTLVWMSRSQCEFQLFEHIFALAYGSSDVLWGKDAQLEMPACKFSIRLHL
jgi:predicted ferric reductase